MYSIIVFAWSILSIIPVEMMTGMKNIARNAARPTIFWLRSTAMNSEKITIAGMSKISCWIPEVSAWTKPGSTNRAS